MVCDVSDESSVAMPRSLSRPSTLGPIDILVANAGTLWMGKTLDTPLKRWELCLRVNLTGTFLVTQAVLPSVMERRTGSLIAVTTTGVFQTELGSNAYWVSKAGIERYYAGLATELAPYDVAVNCLAPRKVVMTEGAVAGGVERAPRHDRSTRGHGAGGRLPGRPVRPHADRDGAVLPRPAGRIGAPFRASPDRPDRPEGPGMTPVIRSGDTAPS